MQTQGTMKELLTAAALVVLLVTVAVVGGYHVGQRSLLAEQRDSLMSRSADAMQKVAVDRIRELLLDAVEEASSRGLTVTHIGPYEINPADAALAVMDLIDLGYAVEWRSEGNSTEFTIKW
jgi:hypothetical protein